MSDPVKIDIDEIDDLLFSCGIVVDTETLDAEIPMDSIMFVSMIVEIENKYGFEVPDDMLLYKYWNTCEIIMKNIQALRLSVNTLENDL